MPVKTNSTTVTLTEEEVREIIADFVSNIRNNPVFEPENVEFMDEVGDPILFDMQVVCSVSKP